MSIKQALHYAGMMSTGIDRLTRALYHATHPGKVGDANGGESAGHALTAIIDAKMKYDREIEVEDTVIPVAFKSLATTISYRYGMPKFGVSVVITRDKHNVYCSVENLGGHGWEYSPGSGEGLGNVSMSEAERIALRRLGQAYRARFGDRKGWKDLIIDANDATMRLGPDGPVITHVCTCGYPITGHEAYNCGRARCSARKAAGRDTRKRKT